MNSTGRGVNFGEFIFFHAVDEYLAEEQAFVDPVGSDGAVKPLKQLLHALSPG